MLSQQDVPDTPGEILILADLNIRIGDRNGGRLQKMPADLPYHVTGELVLVQTLHHHHDGAVLLVDQSMTRLRSC